VDVFPIRDEPAQEASDDARPPLEERGTAVINQILRVQCLLAFSTSRSGLESLSLVIESAVVADQREHVNDHS
jgi:hypothetical protein